MSIGGLCTFLPNANYKAHDLSRSANLLRSRSKSFAFLDRISKGMASSDNPETKEVRVDRENKEEDKEEEKGGFMEKVKDFIQDIGEKIEGAIGFGKPTADVTGVHIPHINLEKAEIVVDVLITNPNPVPIPLVDIDYLIESDGRKLVSGLIPDAGTIHAHGSETVKIPVVLIYDDIKSTYKDIEPGSIIPYKISVALIVDVPILGRLTLPLEKTGEIPVPYKPDVDVEKIKFEKFSFEETTANLHLKLDNKNDFDLGLNALDYEIWLTDVSIGSAELTQSTKLAKRGITSMQLPISFKPKDFGSALWDMLRGRGTGYTIKGNIDVDTPFGNMKLPISKEGGTTRLKKGDDDDDDED
uniref:Water stress and hypersensitive response domain-containing protein n=1 Tax=Ananas comosus var. bracteatus TaxID=296719 RepID=A0A6V7Q222_ANACO|nr:unnamed protein product [Ananas comosus var. bracteatus]